MTDLDYVIFYAEKLRDDNRFFVQQRKLIDSQLKASSSLFKNMFGDEDFKINARKYLKGVGLIN